MSSPESPRPQPAPVPPALPSSPGKADSVVVRVNDLIKTYGEKTENPVYAVKGISFSVFRGELVAVMGHSGSGKSTLMNILGCLDRPTSGEYHLNGDDVSHKTRRQLAHVRSRTLGFVFQSYHLLPRLTARANCEIPLHYAGGVARRERGRRVDDALIRVGLGDKLNRRPTELSGGQQQRVAIARALVNRPALLLADEPTGNLDTKTGYEILALLQELNRDGLTIIMVTHEPNVAACAGRVIRMKDGKLQRVEVNENPADAAVMLREMKPDDEE